MLRIWVHHVSEPLGCGKKGDRKGRERRWNCPYSSVACRGSVVAALRSMAESRIPQTFQLMALVTGEFAVDAMGLGGFNTQTLDAVFLIVVEVTFEPEPLTGVFVGAFPGKDMGGYAV